MRTAFPGSNVGVAIVGGELDVYLISGSGRAGSSVCPLELRTPNDDELAGGERTLPVTGTGMGIAFGVGGVVTAVAPPTSKVMST